MQAVEFWDLIRFVMALNAAEVCIAFVLIYHISTKGDWRRSEYGVHLMTFTGALGLFIGYVVAVLAGWVPEESLAYVGTVIYTTIFAFVVWRIVLLLRAQRRS